MNFIVRHQKRAIRGMLLCTVCILSTDLRVTTTLASNSSTAAHIITPIPLPPSALDGGIILLQPPLGIPPNKIIRLDIYGELLCPDYREFAQTVESRILNKYKHTNLLVILHLFPLPYHHISYVINQAALGLALHHHSIDSGETLRTFRNAIFNEQESFGNGEIMNTTVTEITQRIGDIAAYVGLSREVAMASVMDRHVDLQLRSMLKVAWLRGVTGTPSLYLNSVPLYLAGAETWTTHLLSDVIDSCRITSIVDFVK